MHKVLLFHSIQINAWVRLMSQHAQHHYQLWGWILFIGSAIFFMASSIRADDPVSLTGGALFLVACFVFLVPLVAEFRAKS